MRKVALFSGKSCGRTKDPLSPLSPALPKLQFSLLTILQAQKSDQRRYHDRRGHCPLYSKPGIICKTVAGRSCFQLKDRIGGDQSAVRESENKSLHKIPRCMKSGDPEEAVLTGDDKRSQDTYQKNVHQAQKGYSGVPQMDRQKKQGIQYRGKKRDRIPDGNFTKHISPKDQLLSRRLYRDQQKKEKDGKRIEPVKVQDYIAMQDPHHRAEQIEAHPPARSFEKHRETVPSAGSDLLKDETVPGKNREKQDRYDPDSQKGGINRPGLEYRRPESIPCRFRPVPQYQESVIKEASNQPLPNEYKNKNSDKCDP